VGWEFILKPAAGESCFVYSTLYDTVRAKPIATKRIQTQPFDRLRV
jgi:hypothetical protein